MWWVLFWKEEREVGGLAEESRSYDRHWAFGRYIGSPTGMNIESQKGKLHILIRVSVVRNIRRLLFDSDA